MRTIGIKYRLFAIAFFGIALILSVNKAYAGLDKKRNEMGLVYWHGDPNQPKIALTFDDGPGPITPQVLELLAAHHIRATFFMEGTQVEEYAPIARQVVEAGHEIRDKE